MLWGSGGWDQYRPSNQRRREATHVQTHRIGFQFGAGGGTFDELSENGQAIYCGLVERYGLESDDEDYQRWAAS
jgi:hypothetical protein